MSPIGEVSRRAMTIRPQNKLYLFQINPGHMEQIGTFYWLYPDIVADKNSEGLPSDIQRCLEQSIINVTLGKSQDPKDQKGRHEFHVNGRNWPRYGWEWATY